jgi:hypothetical protein
VCVSYSTYVIRKEKHFCNFQQRTNLETATREENGRSRVTTFVRGPRSKILNHRKEQWTINYKRKLETENLPADTEAEYSEPMIRGTPEGTPSWAPSSWLEPHKVGTPPAPNVHALLRTFSTTDNKQLYHLHWRYTHTDAEKGSDCLSVVWKKRCGDLPRTYQLAMIVTKTTAET